MVQSGSAPRGVFLFNHKTKWTESMDALLEVMLGPAHSFEKLAHL
jgi:hypothetical protein